MAERPHHATLHVDYETATVTSSLNAGRDPASETMWEREHCKLSVSAKRRTSQHRFLVSCKNNLS